MEDRICITKEAKGLGFFEKYLTQHSQDLENRKSLS